MFRIRRVHDDISPANRNALDQVLAILREQFPLIRAKEIEELPRKLREHLRFGFQTMLFVAERPAGRVQGFALALYDPLLSFCYLDWIAAAGSLTGRGVGDVLYRRVREEAVTLGCTGVFSNVFPMTPCSARVPKGSGRMPPGCVFTNASEPARSGGLAMKRLSNQVGIARRTLFLTISERGNRFGKKPPGTSSTPYSRKNTVIFVLPNTAEWSWSPLLTIPYV